jgi:Dyp-type peroxidase family
VTHSFITVVIPFGADPQPVETALISLGNPPNQEVASALDATEIVHFMSMHALRAAAEDEPHLLVIEMTVDGGVRRALDELVRCLGGRLTGVLESAGVKVAPPELAAFLARHHRPVGQSWFATPGLNFSGTPGMSVRRIRQERVLAKHVAELLGQAPRKASALAKLAFVRERLWQQGDYKWAFAEDTWPFRESAIPFPLWKSIGLLPSAIRVLLWPLLLPAAAAFAVTVFFLAAGSARWIYAALAAALVLAATAGATYLALRRREKTDVPDDEVPDAPRCAEILEREDHGAQNHLLVLSELKPGLLRRFTLRLAFFAVGQLVARSFRPGFLSEIGTIHFARWIVLPGTSRLLFLSNYGGSWESYLEDFIRRAHQGLTAVWSNTRGFPRTTRLFEGGASDGARFKAWARRQQQPTRFWYSAYRNVTTGRIRAHAEIRRGIAAARTEDAAARWLALLGAPARPPRALASEQVSALLFGGFRAQRYARAFLLRLPEGEGRARSWLAELEPLASYGEDCGDDRTALAVAFSASGLRKLGLTAGQLANFPVAFQHGSELRGRILGDVGLDAPERWDWGNARRPVDALLLLYARTEPDLIAFEAKLRGLAHAQFEGCHAVRMAPLPEEGLPVEPFGFKDGVSQPIIRGTRREHAAELGDQRVATGEMILGYEDGLAFFPPTPLVEPSADPLHLLAETGYHERPTGPRPRNLGQDGTYLVVRQLEQHVNAFEAFLKQAAACPEVRDAAPAGVACEEWVAAKMVGRWRDGTSLVRHPTQPGTAAGARPDNDFLFGLEDPDGLRCPFGAHVRRANPRDSFDAGSQAQLEITDRHRILRVGRPYEPGNGREARGLFFMCINADIERQFEFVQQSWMRSPGFHNLDGEVDPIFARGGEGPAAMTIPTPHGPIALRGMADFVTLIGSGYFFLPGRGALRFLACQDHRRADRSARGLATAQQRAVAEPA